MNSFPKMYFIPGLGVDSRVFQNLRLQGLDFEVIEWETPTQNEPFESYLNRIASKINTDAPFVLGGVSFGGMCAQSLAERLKPEKLVLVSTIRNSSQFPFFLRQAIQLGMNRMVNGKVLKYLAKIALPIRSKAKFPDGRPFSSIIEDADPYLLKWSIDQASVWKATEWKGPVLHLHGDKDKLFPVTLLQNVTVIEGGDHLMVSVKAKEIAQRIKDFIRQEV